MMHFTGWEVDGIALTPLASLSYKFGEELVSQYLIYIDNKQLQAVLMRELYYGHECPGDS